MKNLKRWFLTAVLIVTALTMAVQRSSAEVLSNYNGFGLNTTINALFGNGASTGLSETNLSGTFDASGTSVFLLSTSPVHYFTTFTLFGNSETADIYYSGITVPIPPTGLTAGRIDFTPGTGGLNFKLNTNQSQGPYYSNPEIFGNPWESQGGTAALNHFAYINVTDLMWANYASLMYNGATAYIVGFEGTWNNGGDAGGNYNDTVFLVITGAAEGGEPGGVPEPATMFLWTLGGLSLAGASWRRKRNMKKLLA